MSDYKNTLNLPETGFPMRGDLAKREPQMLDNWYKEGLYQAIREAKSGKKMFILHDGLRTLTAIFILVTQSTKFSKILLLNPKGYQVLIHRISLDGIAMVYQSSIKLSRLSVNRAKKFPPLNSVPNAVNMQKNKSKARKLISFVLVF